MRTRGKTRGGGSEEENEEEEEEEEEEEDRRRRGEWGRRALFSATGFVKKNRFFCLSTLNRENCHGFAECTRSCDCDCDRYRKNSDRAIVCNVAWGTPQCYWTAIGNSQSAIALEWRSNTAKKTNISACVLAIEASVIGCNG